MINCEIISIYNADIYNMAKEMAAVLFTILLFCMPGILLIIRKKTDPELKILFLFLSVFISKISYIAWLRYSGKSIILWIILHIILSVFFCGLLRNKILFHHTGSGLNTKDIIALIFIVIFAAVFTLLPQAMVASAGENLYRVRAYFVPDYLKHIAVSAELSKGAIPPANPFFSGENLHYYWIYYLIPSFAYNILGRAGSLLRLNIFANQLVNIGLLISLYIFSNIFIKKALTKVFLILSLLFASSYEGLIYIYETIGSRAGIFANYVNYNIDGLTRWRYGQPQIDSVYRSLMYTPQQQMGFIGLILFFYFAFCRKDSSCIRNYLHFILPVIAGVILGYNFFCGIFISLWLFIAYPVFRLMEKSNIYSVFKKWLIMLAIFMIFPVFYRVLDMFLHNSSPVNAGFNIYRAFNLALIFLINYSWLWLSLVILFIQILRRKKESVLTLVDFGRYLSLVITAVLLISFFQIKGFEADIGLKIGQVLNIILFFGWLLVLKGVKTRLIYFLLVILVIPAFITSVIDFSNSRDIEKAPRDFIITFRLEDICAMRDIRDKFFQNAVIQALPGRDDKRACIVPIFAERRTALADEMHSRIYILGDERIYRDRLELVSKMFHAVDTDQVYQIAEQLGIDFLFVGTVERQIPAIISNLDRFPKAYEGYGTTVYDVRRDE